MIFPVFNLPPNMAFVEGAEGCGYVVTIANTPPTTAKITNPAITIRARCQSCIFELVFSRGLAAVTGCRTGEAVGISAFNILSLKVIGDPRRERCRKIRLGGK